MTTVTPIPFDIAYFRATFPAFAATPPTDGTLQGYWDLATVYIDDRDYSCWMLTGKVCVLALNQMTAHLAQLYAVVAAADTPQAAQIAMDERAQIDKVSVSVTPPPNKTQFDWWLGLTPYGQMLLALLQGVTAGGFFVPSRGVPERVAFRKAGGGFGG